MKENLNSAMTSLRAAKIMRVAVVGAGPGGVAASKYVFRYLLPITVLDPFKSLTSLIGWPSDISLPRAALIPSISLNSRLRLVASGIIRTTPSTRLIFPRPIHISLWMNQSGTLFRTKMASQVVHNMQHLCPQCMNIWRPIFHTPS